MKYRYSKNACKIPVNIPGNNEFESSLHIHYDDHQEYLGFVKIRLNRNGESDAVFSQRLRVLCGIMKARSIMEVVRETNDSIEFDMKNFVKNTELTGLVDDLMSYVTGVLSRYVYVLSNEILMFDKKDAEIDTIKESGISIDEYYSIHYNKPVTQ